MLLRRRRIGGGLLSPGLLGVPLGALLRVRSEPNFHRNNDTKSGEGMQGLGACGRFGFFALRT